MSILLRAAQELALLVGSLRRQLWAEGEQARVAWIGGVFRSALLLDRFRMLMSLEDTECRPPDHGPAVGALLLAYRAAGLTSVQILPPPAVGPS